MIAQVYVAVALPQGKTRGLAALVLVAYDTQGARKIVKLTSDAEGTANQAVARGLLTAMARLQAQGQSATIFTNLQAAVPAPGRPQGPEGEDFAGLIATVVRRCRETGCTVAWCRSSEERMAHARGLAAGCFSSIRPGVPS